MAILKYKDPITGEFKPYLPISGGSDYHVYSTEEKVVGEFLGKTFYEKTFIIDNVNSGDYFETGLSNLDEVMLDVTGERQSKWVSNTYYYDANGHFTVQLNKEHGKVWIIYPSGTPFRHIILTVKYSKLSDTPSLESEPMMALNDE